MEKPRLHSPFLRRLCALLALFALIFLIIFVIRSFPKKESRFTDTVVDGPIRLQPDGVVQRGLALFAIEGLGGWEWTSAYQDIVYEGDAQYTVDLSHLSQEDFTVNNELKTLTVRIPYAVLSPINIPADKIKFRDVKKGWAAPKDIKLTAEESAQLMIQVSNKMKAKLIDENIIDAANRDAKLVVADLLSTTVQAVDPEFTVVVVQ